MNPEHPVRQGLEAQLRQLRAIYKSRPNEVNRYQMVRLERLLAEVSV